MKTSTRLLSCVAALLCSLSTGVWAQDNTAPLPILIPNHLLVTAGALATVDATQSFDPEGDPFTFNWTQLLGDPVTISEPTSGIFTFTAPLTAQTLQFVLTVTDYNCINPSNGCGDSSSVSFNVVVSSVPEPAAVWLLGSGVITLLGFARLRRRSV